MKRIKINILFWAILGIMAVSGSSHAQDDTTSSGVDVDSIGTLRFPFADEEEFLYPDQIPQRPLYLGRPSNIDRKIEYDPETRQYIIYEKVGNMYYRLPKTMTLPEYVKYDFDMSVKEYWKTRSVAESVTVERQQTGLIPQLQIESEAFVNIFGSDIIDIRPQGYVEVQFGLESNYFGDETLPERMRRATTFDFENQINISVNGKIGEKVNMDFNYNTEATFDFENKMNMEYSGGEDEILRRIEAGNVSLPLNGSLIQGGTNLFGIKTEMQFGRLNVTTVMSQHKGESQVIETEGGAQKTYFEIKASEYDENRHFFLSKFFRDKYDEALSMLPVIRSQIDISRIELWVTNKNQNFTSARNIVSFVDLGEPEGYISNSVSGFEASGINHPGNEANGMYNTLINNYSGIRNSTQANQLLGPLRSQGFEIGRDWEKIDQARRLNDSEYNINTRLGFISLNTPLNNDEVLAVAFEYTYNGEVFQVGEFTGSSVEPGEALFLKLIKGTTLSPQSPTWDLMMKNIYNLGAYGLSSSDFDFQVLYKNDSTNTYINYLPESELRDTILLRLMNLDNLNSQNDYAPRGDGMFDYIENVTIYSQTGRIIFPVLEPFGSNIADNISDPNLKEKYAYTSLYNQTKTKAKQDFSRDKFALVGSYKGSSGSEIALNAFNLAPGSVVVSAGGQRLEEDIDYVVDYAIGRVKIINEGLIEAGTPIQVSTESQELISTQRKTMVGSYASYYFSDKLNFGGTMLFMNERPITNKVAMGQEPVSNLMLGLDFQYRDRSELLTDIVNLLPFYKSDVASSISMEGEVARLITGRSRTIGNQIYIDDFEGVETSYSFMNPQGWHLASAPQHQPDKFPEAQLNDDLAYGYNRARLAWYYVDREVFSSLSSKFMPAYMKANPDLISNHYSRSINVREIFPGRQIPPGAPNFIMALNMAYYPSEKGPYNFDAEAGQYSAGVDENNSLLSPETRWGGMMRDIKTPNFEASNIEYIEFWLLDPFIYDEGTHRGGDLYFNLGDVSEDILRDSRKAFENGLPIGDTDEDVEYTAWGRVSTKNQLGVGFENDAQSRIYQDVGLDGLNDDGEASHFSDYLEKLQNILSPEAWNKIIADPAKDNFRYYRGTGLDEMEASVFERYKYYNNPEGNTPITGMSTEPYSMVGKINPDKEDINGDNTLNELEAYYQYRVSVRPEDMNVGSNFIVDKVNRSVELPNKEVESVTWYQFKIPITNENAFEKVGGISDFRSIRFMRMFLTNFEDSVMLRFGTLNLVRSDWRKEERPMLEEGSNESSNATLEVTSIDIEESNSRTPINYVLPPGIEREQDPSSPTYLEQNERSMLLKVYDLESGDGRAVYKSLGMDLRQFKRLQMEVHAEAIDGYPINDDELSVFIRLGSDRDHYYEYEIPLKLTPVPATSYNNDILADRFLVWPEENRLYVELKKFSDLKLRRDAAINQPGESIIRNMVYQEIDTESINSKNIIRVKGNPSLGEVDLVHIGIRNPKSKDLGPKSVEVWVNELRVSDFNERGGWASSGRMSVRLADLGSLSLSGRTNSVGWGSINQPAAMRSLENRYQYDIAATADAGKILPEAIGLRMPLFYSYSQSVASPEYNPLSSDIKMSDAIEMIESPEKVEELLAISQDVVTRKSFNVNNISIEPQRKNKERKPLPTDIENFSVSYAKNEQMAHNVDIQKNLQRSEKGVFNYNYTARANYITPLSNVDFLKPKVFALLRDFNFSLVPEMISFRTDLTRNYRERKARDNSGFNIEMPTTVQKDFLWNRYFDFRYNPSRSLRIDFTNRSVARIDELDGIMDKELYPDQYQLMLDEIYRNLSNFGRSVDYQHSLTVDYRIPINKLPLLDWTNASVNYSGSYDWLAGPILPERSGESKIEVGNNAGNSMNFRLTGNLTFVTLYNKVPYFKNINSRFQSSRQTYGSRARIQQTQQQANQTTEEPKRTREVKYTERKVSFRADVPKSVFHRLGTREVTITVSDERGEPVEGEIIIIDDNRINFKTEKAVREATVLVNGVKEIEELFIEKAFALTTRMLLAVRSVRLIYNKTGATQLPGFLPDPYLFGMRNDATTGNRLAPTIPFLLGWQDPDFALEAARLGWVTTDNSIQKQYLLQSSETWDFSAQLEPIANIKIDLTGNWRESQNVNSYINYNEEDFAFELQNRRETGNFDMTIITLRTLFRDGLSGDSETSDIFDQFRYRNIDVISNRLNQQRGWVEGEGYGMNPDETVPGVSKQSTDVIIPAFIAAYTGADPNNIALTSRPGLSSVRPNWRINFNGNPQRIDWMKDYVHSLNFSHSYQSRYSIGRFETNLAYNPDNNGFSWVRDGEMFIPELNITSINIQESFNPLINVDVGFHNNLSTRFEIRKTRNLNLDFAANQLNEMIRNEFSMGIGYRLSGLDLILKTRQNTQKLSNDVNLRLDVTSSNYKNVLRRIDVAKGELNGGVKVLSLNFQADYMASDKLNVKLYYQYSVNDPHSSISGFRRTNTKFGLSFNFTIM